MASSSASGAPARWVRWVLMILAVLLAVVAAVAVFLVARPVGYGNPGTSLAMFFLAYPLHLLGVTLLALVLGLLAWRHRSRVPMALCAVALVLSLIAALWPSTDMWRYARQANVPLSLGTYAANAFRANLGEPQPDRTRTYGTASDGTELKLDVWQAENAPDNHPAVVMVHGGAWVKGTRGMAPDWNRWLNERGYDVFDVGYRLAPPMRGKQEVGDVKCALGWVASHAAEYGIDPQRISMMGQSAGGNLALLAAYSTGDYRLPASCDVPDVPVASVVNMYGPTELARGYRTTGSGESVREAMRKYLGGSPDERPDLYRLLSPLYYVDEEAPPTLTLLGRRDRLVPVDQAKLLGAALDDAGVRHETWLLPGTDHGFDSNWGGLATQFARDRIADFLPPARG
ncbi:alpha/beta hydrolase [Nocardiopsis rhodophaea]